LDAVILFRTRSKTVSTYMQYEQSISRRYLRKFDYFIIIQPSKKMFEADISNP
jgi:hypothetical protein